MRLYEFANPRGDNLPGSEAADLPRQIVSIWDDDKFDNVKPQS